MMNYGITNTFLFAYFTVFDHLYCIKKALHMFSIDFKLTSYT